MTVAELIDVLKECNPDAKVLYCASTFPAEDTPCDNDYYIYDILPWSSGGCKETAPTIELLGQTEWQRNAASRARQNWIP